MTFVLIALQLFPSHPAKHPDEEAKIKEVIICSQNINSILEAKAKPVSKWYYLIGSPKAPSPSLFESEKLSVAVFIVIKSMKGSSSEVTN